MFPQLYQLARNKTTGPVLPLELIVFVSERCPLRCAHCFIDEFQTDPKTDLPLDVIERLARDLPDLLVVMLTGGEPFLRGDLPEVVDAFNRNSRPRVVTITTAGWFPEKTERMVARMLGRLTGATQLIINLSFDGTRETHDEVRRRKGSFDRAIDTAQRLANLRDRFSRLAIGANMTIVPANQHRILDAARELAGRNLFSFLSCNMYRETVPRRAFRGIDLNRYRELARFVREYSLRFSMGADALIGRLHHAKEQLQADLIERACRTGRHQGVDCEAGRNIGVVYSDGRVAACELLQADWGNIKTRSFADIWNDRRNRKRSDDIRRTECFCTHECFLSASLNTQVGGLCRSVAGALRSRPSDDSSHRSTRP